MEQEFIEDSLMIISKPTMDKFLEQKNPADLMALYMFYYYTAKWQKTNRPKATTSYVANGLNWSENRVRRTKNVLIQLKLIENAKDYSKEHKIKGWYIKIKYLWGANATNKVVGVIKKDNNHPNENTQGGKPHSVDNQETNALSVNSINALSVNKKNIQPKAEVSSLKTKTKGKAKANKKSIPEDDYIKIENYYTKRFEDKSDGDPPDYSYPRDRKILQPLIKKYGVKQIINYMELWFDDDIGDWCGYTITGFKANFQKLLLKDKKREKSWASF